MRRPVSANRDFTRRITFSIGRFTYLMLTSWPAFFKSLIFLSKESYVLPNTGIAILSRLDTARAIKIFAIFELSSCTAVARVPPANSSNLSFASSQSIIKKTPDILARSAVQQQNVLNEMYEQSPLLDS